GDGHACTAGRRAARRVDAGYRWRGKHGDGAFHYRGVEHAVVFEHARRIERDRRRGHAGSYYAGIEGGRLIVTRGGGIERDIIVRPRHGGTHEDGDVAIAVGTVVGNALDRNIDGGRRNRVAPLEDDQSREWQREHECNRNPAPSFHQPPQPHDSPPVW